MDPTAPPPVPQPGLLVRRSSRQGRLDRTFLVERLRGARTYKRIAGYFRSSIFEIADEEIAAIDQVRIVCNADLDPRDVKVAHLLKSGLKEQVSGEEAVIDAFLDRARYARLHECLSRGNVDIRFLARDVCPFLHGKAGVVEGRDGSRVGFMGSVNETREGWSQNYEILWEDLSPEGVDWVDQEFEWLWSQGARLDEADLGSVVAELGRLAHRQEFKAISAVPQERLAAAAVVEAPIYRRGESLQPWQRAFVELVAKHRRIYGKARFVIADEVGLGKTLSLATAALYLSLLGDGPVLLMVPSTLTIQWQTELLQHLGIRAWVWTQGDAWLDPDGRTVPMGGPDGVGECPGMFGIVSTGLVVKMSKEREALLRRSFGTVVLDEGHKARREMDGDDDGDSNNLHDFMVRAATYAVNVLIGTATPVQTHPAQIWHLMEILAQNADFVLGSRYSPWRQWREAIPVLKGEVVPKEMHDLWDWIRSPLPNRDEHRVFDALMSDLHGLEQGKSSSSIDVSRLGPDTVDDLLHEAGARRSGTTFLQRHNPFIRHIVLRRRGQLEDRKLLKKIDVRLHPRSDSDHHVFVGGKVEPGDLLGGDDGAMHHAAEYTKARVARARAAGSGGGSAFIKSILMQRIGSSAAAGLSTARKLLGEDEVERDEDDDQEVAALFEARKEISPEERRHLGLMISKLEALDRAGGDPKFKAVRHYLKEMGWYDLGCIVFSQYYDTVDWVASKLSAEFPEWRFAVYAGTGRSRIHHGGQSIAVKRDFIKDEVKQGRLQLVLATDAACEGLNLQRLGTLINVDLPWNPSRLEQRIGRIKRIGQVRDMVDVLNLLYRDSWDERIHGRLSTRLKDRYDVFGGLPDVLFDDWIGDEKAIDAKIDEFIEANRRMSLNAFDLVYGATIEPKGEDWALCEEVISRKDFDDLMSRPWERRGRPRALA